MTDVCEQFGRNQTRRVKMFNTLVRLLHPSIQSFVDNFEGSIDISIESKTDIFICYPENYTDRVAIEIEPLKIRFFSNPDFFIFDNISN